jgi:hypothetical protein
MIPGARQLPQQAHCRYEAGEPPEASGVGAAYVGGIHRMPTLFFIVARCWKFRNQIIAICGVKPAGSKLRNIFVSQISRTFSSGP